MPAEYRGLLALQGGQKLYVFPTLRPDPSLPPSIDVWSEQRVQALAATMQGKNPFSREAQIVGALMGRMTELSWAEPEGRITIPAWLLEHAGIDEELQFVGATTHFEIWNPEQRGRYEAKVLGNAYDVLSQIDFSQTTVAEA